jgi:hypothetical protein
MNRLLKSEKKKIESGIKKTKLIQSHEAQNPRWRLLCRKLACAEREDATHMPTIKNTTFWEIKPMPRCSPLSKTVLKPPKAAAKPL